MTADVKNYYPAYDLLKVTNSVNLFVLIDQILEEQSKSLLQQLTKADFDALLEEIYWRINLMGRWLGVVAWGQDKRDDEELMRRYGDV